MAYGYSVGATIRPLPCGCTVQGARDETDATPEMGVGTIPNPWTVKLCESHAQVQIGGPLSRCVRCGKSKPPRGRSVPMLAADVYCHRECTGYDVDPQATRLWPGEVGL